MSEGRAIIALQDAISDLGIADPAEQQEFVNSLADGMRESVRQQLLTWRHNRSTGADVQRAGELDKARRTV